MEEPFEPGTAPYGNFINYYSFNPPETRVQLVANSPKFLTTLRQSAVINCLDIGCNAGDLTLGLANVLKSEGCAVKMLGVDIDPVLVERARQNAVDDSNGITFECLDVTNESLRDTFLTEWLKPAFSSCEAPTTVKFNTIFCFSTTMWIHLNNGDEGLENFLRFLSQWTDSLIIEPQPWKCYRNAARRMRRVGKTIFSSFSSLRFNKPIQDIDRILTSCGMQLIENLGNSDWERPVMWYQKKKHMLNEPR